MNKKKLKRREEKEENNKKKRFKNYIKKEKPKKIRAAYLRRVQHSSEGRSKALRAQRSSDRVQHSSERCSLAQRVQRTAQIGCGVAQWKDIRPWRPEFGPEGTHFVSGNSFFFIFGGAAKLR
jgi:hypothetical protein